MRLKIYSDGASRSNPGPSAIAFIILNDRGLVLKESSEYVGIGTNNQAEYKALIAALKSAINYGGDVVCCSDSALVVKQLNGEYEVHDAKMRTLWRKVIALKERFKKITFVHVPRTHEYIVRVDKLVNQTLDAEENALLEHRTKERNHQLDLDSFSS